MAQNFSRIIVDGFYSGEFDFGAALARQPQPEQNRVTALVATLLLAEAHPDEGLYVSVTVVGESDRYDAPGASIEECRARELEESEERAHRAGRWLMDQLKGELAAMSLPVPADATYTTNVGICYALKGAADLVHLLPASEAERQQNRRVRFLVLTFRSPYELAWDPADRLGAAEPEPADGRL